MIQDQAHSLNERLLTHILAPRSDVLQCYWPTKQPSTTGWPCDRTAKITNCCAIGFTCLDNGLCSKTEDPNYIIRGSCTDENFSTEACPSMCSDTYRMGGPFISCANVTGDDRDVCCNNNKSDCCNSGDGRIRLNKIGNPVRAIDDTEYKAYESTTSLSAMASPTTPSSTTRSPTGPGAAMTTASADKSESSGMNVGVIVGISMGVAGLLGLIALLATAFYLGRRKRKRKAAADATAKEESMAPSTNISSPNRGTIAEMYGGFNNKELPELPAEAMSPELPVDLRSPELESPSATTGLASHRWRGEMPAGIAAHELPGGQDEDVAARSWMKLLMETPWLRSKS